MECQESSIDFTSIIDGEPSKSLEPTVMTLETDLPNTTRISTIELIIMLLNLKVKEEDSKASNHFD